MTFLTAVVKDKTELGDKDIEHLQALLADWTLLADLSLSDLVLWIPTWHGKGFFAAAQIRPATTHTNVPEDLVGEFIASGRRVDLDKALTTRRKVGDLNNSGLRIEAVPVVFEEKVIAVISRHTSADGRGGRLEQVYLAAAQDLMEMVASGSFPAQGEISKANQAPRVGDGIIHLTKEGLVDFVSPNASSAFRRLGFASDLINQDLSKIVTKLQHKPGPVDEAIMLISSGRASGEVELDNSTSVVTFRGVPLLKNNQRVGSLVLVRDVADLRRKEKALLTKDATIREVHHRVKNNLQTVAALLRLQARRAKSEETKDSLAEAQRRVSAIAVVHEALSRSPGEVITFDEVINQVIALVTDASTIVENDKAIGIELQGEFGQLPAEIATPLAMAVVEILQNAIEHGRPTNAPVQINASKSGGQIRITITDEGPGIEKGKDVFATDQLGLQIVRTLIVDELGGGLTISANSPTGVKAEIVAPIVLRKSD
jgi:two-component system, sensor histidine kinase PdtaS